MEKDLSNLDIKNVLIVGDVHGNLAWWHKILDATEITTTDIILQVGDFGYWPHREWGQKYLAGVEKLLAERNLSCVFVDGNHDNHEWLFQLPKRADGFVEVSPHVIYAPRTHRWTWNNVRFMSLGGASSIDRGNRSMGASWWPQELLSSGDYYKAVDGEEIDVLVCHDTPSKVKLDFKADDMPTVSNRMLLQAVVEATHPKLVVHGHYHSLIQQKIALTNGGFSKVVGLSRDKFPDAVFALKLPSLKMKNVEIDLGIGTGKDVVPEESGAIEIMRDLLD
jgi:Icc-related predicted phosphoesterase